MTHTNPPPVSELRGKDTPIELDDCTIIEFKITPGNPQHGAMRSDSHVSKYVVQYEDECPSCGYSSVIKYYNAYHFIAGSIKIICNNCDHIIEQERWG